MVDSHDCILSASILRDEDPKGQRSGASLLELVRCHRINLQGLQLIDGTPYGIDAEDCREITISGCTVAGDLLARRSQGAIRFRGPGTKNLISTSQIDAALDLDDASGVKVVQSVGDGIDGR